MQSNIIEELAESLPPIILRSKVESLTGGLVNKKTLSNHDAKDKGPKDSGTLYGKKVYTKKSFLEYLAKGLSEDGKGKRPSPGVDHAES